MEAFPQRPPADRSKTSVDRQHRSGKSKIERIGAQTKGLFEDFTDWIELRLKLFQLEVQEKIQKKLNEAAIKVAPIIVGALAGVFALVSAALFIGWWLGHPAWGFLIVTGLLFVVTGVFYVRSRSLDSEGKEAEWSRSDGAAES